MTLAYIFLLLLRATILLTFIISLLFCFRKYNPPYLRFFPFYHLFAISVEVIVDVFFYKEQHSMAIQYSVPYNLFAFVEFLFFSFLIYSHIRVKTLRIILSTFAISAFALFISLHVVMNTLNLNIGKSMLVFNIYFILACLLYLMDLFWGSFHPDLSRAPIFWIVVGIFSYSVIVTPTLIFNNQNSELSNYIYLVIHGTAYLSLHLSFIKAYVCKSPKLLYQNS